MLWPVEGCCFGVLYGELGSAAASPSTWICSPLLNLQTWLASKVGRFGAVPVHYYFSDLLRYAVKRGCKAKFKVARAGLIPCILFVAFSKEA